MINNRKWNYSSASVIGASHIKMKTPCQDFYKCDLIEYKEESPILVIIASDGAGSAIFSDTGAKIMCYTILEKIKGFLLSGHFVQEINKEIVIEWLRLFLKLTELYAKKKNTIQKEFACTLLGAVVDIEYSCFFQIGDGAIIISPQDHKDEYSYVFWPNRGEYENTTYFATDYNWEENLLFAVKKQSINEIAVLTDGIQNLALHYQSRTVFNPFFKPLFTYLRSSPLECKNRINYELERFLTSDKVNKRIDDDKTLILATRLIDLEELC